ncbi:MULTISPECIES: hypothetical protein [Actinomadura]|uniref:Uncharacterized protein n=1 Tax=Actinomadura yumaensis TaxID=111807 RepID=A0ABW2CM51_9ACTN|nr:hypothetical protein [Actinomadura sp. J1-007]MWK34234.1 hypothetical protein [Actinomadura sp. J1-007]
MFAGLGASDSEDMSEQEVLEVIGKLDHAKNGVLGEMVQDLLGGKITLRQIGESEVYREALMPGIEKFMSWHANLADQEMGEALSQGQRFIDETRRESS